MSAWLWKTKGLMQKAHKVFSRTKSIESALQDSEKKELNRVLNWVDVIAFGLGEIIGAGIFVLTGVAAKTKAGPGVIFSYAFAGFTSIFSALCYAEFAARVPVAGSAYTYSYVVAGELLAWIIGWDLTLEYMVAAATVARGWSGYLVTFFNGFGVILPSGFTNIDIGFATIDPTAACIVILLTILLTYGVRDSSRFNLILVIFIIAVIVLVCIQGLFFADINNWTPFLPFGISGVFEGASLVFFAYVGFDSVTTLAEEMTNSKKDLPIGIIGSLLISVLLYVAVAAVLTLMIPIESINIDSPLASAFAGKGAKWMEVVISLGAFAALTTTILNSMLGQARIYFSMARDGLLFPWLAKVHPRFKTPINATIVTGFLSVLLALFFPIEQLAEMVSIGTLLAFTIVCGSILSLRYQENQNQAIALVFSVVMFTAITATCVTFQVHIAVIVIFTVITLVISGVFFRLKKTTELAVGFMCPWVPVVPILGIYSNVYMMVNLSLNTWIRLLVWLLIGFVIYFGYSIKHSKLSSQSNGEVFHKIEEEEFERDRNSIDSSAMVNLDDDDDVIVSENNKENRESREREEKE